MGVSMTCLECPEVTTTYHARNAEGLPVQSTLACEVLDCLNHILSGQASVGQQSAYHLQILLVGRLGTCSRIQGYGTEKVVSAEHPHDNVKKVSKSVALGDCKRGQREKSAKIAMYSPGINLVTHASPTQKILAPMIAAKYGDEVTVSV